MCVRLGVVVELLCCGVLLCWMDVVGAAVGAGGQLSLNSCSWPGVSIVVL